MDPLKSVRSLDPAKTAFSLFDEFKAFAFKGNVIDLAVGVIIGAAFGKIVDSLVKQIIMPLVSVVLPGKQRLSRLEVGHRRQGGPLRPLPRRRRQLRDRGAGVVLLHRQVPRLADAHQEGRVGHCPEIDEGPGASGRDPRPFETTRGYCLI